MFCYSFMFIFLCIINLLMKWNDSLFYHSAGESCLFLHTTFFSLHVVILKSLFHSNESNMRQRLSLHKFYQEDSLLIRGEKIYLHAFTAVRTLGFNRQFIIAVNALIKCLQISQVFQKEPFNNAWINII